MIRETTRERISNGTWNNWPSSIDVATNCLIVQQVDVIRMEPLFPMLSAHLCCGLSHIDSYIQRDSLKHLDEILNSLPGKIFIFLGHGIDIRRFASNRHCKNYLELKLTKIRKQVKVSKHKFCFDQANYLKAMQIFNYQ